MSSNLVPAVQWQSEGLSDALISASHRLHHFHAEHIHISCDNGPSLKDVYSLSCVIWVRYFVFDAQRVCMEFYLLNYSIFILNSVREALSFYVYTVWSLVSSTKFDY